MIGHSPSLISRRHAVACGIGLPLVSLAAWAQDADFLASVPLEPNEGGAPIFQIALNGVPARSVLEFDMPAVAIDRAFAAENGLSGAVEVGVGQLRQSVTPVLANFSGMITAFGDPIHAVVGRPILDRFGIVIDAPAGRLHVLRPNVSVDAAGSTQAFDIVLAKGRAGIDVSLEGGPSLRAALSYFNGAAISLRETETVERWLGDGRPSSTAFAGSVGNPSAIDKVFSLKSVALGKHVLQDVPVMAEPLGPANAAGPDVVLGPLLLNKFVITLLSSARQIWFTPAPTTFDQPIRRSMTGVYAIPAPAGLEVKHIGSNSPASTTRLKVGDIIATIDGAPAKRAALIEAVAGQALNLGLTSGATLKIQAAKYF